MLAQCGWLPFLFINRCPRVAGRELLVAKLNAVGGLSTQGAGWMTFAAMAVFKRRT